MLLQDGSSLPHTLQAPTSTMFILWKVMGRVRGRVILLLEIALFAVEAKVYRDFKIKF